MAAPALTADSREMWFHVGAIRGYSTLVTRPQLLVAVARLRSSKAARLDRITIYDCTI